MNPLKEEGYVCLVAEQEVRKTCSFWHEIMNTGSQIFYEATWEGTQDGLLELKVVPGREVTAKQRPKSL